MFHIIIDCCRCCDLPIEQCPKGPPTQTYEVIQPAVEEVEKHGGSVRDPAGDHRKRVYDSNSNSHIEHSA